MNVKNKVWMCLAGTSAGLANSLLGAGGGMFLIPMLSHCNVLNKEELFPASVATMLPVCLSTVILDAAKRQFLPDQASLYLLGSCLGGILCARWGKRIPVKWLHRGLGLLVLAGGVHNLCSIIL